LRPATGPANPERKEKLPRLKAASLKGKNDAEAACGSKAKKTKKRSSPDSFVL
jgi:hypothetical protein